MVETWALSIAVIIYVLAFGFYIAAVVWSSDRLNSVALILSAAAFISQTVSIIARWVSTGHPPVFGSFENALAGSWFVILFGLVISKKTPWLKIIGLFTTPMALAIIAFGVGFDSTRFPLTISEQSLWVDLHATFAWFSYSSYTLAFIIAVLILVNAREHLPFLNLPSLGVMDDWLMKYVIFGFVTQTFTLASGAYYEFIVFGTWWRWDPIESMTLASWFLYALFIHLKKSFAWDSRRLSWLAIISMITVIAAYWLMAYFPPGSTFHVFDIGPRVHIN